MHEFRTSRSSTLCPAPRPGPGGGGPKDALGRLAAARVRSPARSHVRVCRPEERCLPGRTAAEGARARSPEPQHCCTWSRKEQSRAARCFFPPKNSRCAGVSCLAKGEPETSHPWLPTTCTRFVPASRMGLASTSVYSKRHKDATWGSAGNACHDHFHPRVPGRPTPSVSRPAREFVTGNLGGTAENSGRLPLTPRQRADPIHPALAPKLFASLGPF